MIRPAAVTVVVPTIPQRAANGMLQDALDSVTAQDLWRVHVAVQVETAAPGEPASVVRHRGLERVGTEWVAFLDDDDVLYPQHLRRCLAHLIYADADLVYPWFDVEGGSDPFPQFFGQPWNNHLPHQTTVTFLARTEAVLQCGGFLDQQDEDGVGQDPDGNRAGEEYRLVLRMVEAGLKIEHLPERTWQWRHWVKPDGTPGNTSGLPSRIQT